MTTPQVTDVRLARLGELFHLRVYLDYGTTPELYAITGSLELVFHLIGCYVKGRPAELNKNETTTESAQ